MILLGAQLFLTGLLGEMVIKQRMEDASTYDIAEYVAVAGEPDPATRYTGG